MVIVEGTTIRMTRGDTATLTIHFDGDIPEDGTLCVMSVKTNVFASTPLIEKSLPVEDGAVTFDLLAEDTIPLAVGEYKWDIRLFYETGEWVATPFMPAPFIVLGVVGNDR